MPTDEELAALAEQRTHRAETRRPTVPALEELLFAPIPCLDHGFVRVVDYMGDDAAVVQAARVSYGKGTRKVSEDRGLIRYLMRHRHTTPLEMCELKLHVKLPIFVARQWIRHRTACLAGDTRLLFEDHEQTLADVHAGWHGADRDVLAAKRLRMCDEDTGEIRTTTITDVWSTGVKPVFAVTLANGYALTMTADHHCLTNKGWKTLKEATGLARSKTDSVLWRAGGLELAVNGVPAPSGDGGVLRTFSPIVHIAYVGEAPTFDLSVAGPFHNFVANGLIVHNSVNEYSARYSILDREFYLPRAEDLAVQSPNNKQGRGDTLSPESAEEVLALLRRDATTAYDSYEKLMDEHQLARELARMNLPVNYYTQWYWKIDLHNLLHFLALRIDPHAQYEIRVYGEAMAKIAKAWVPLCWEAFEDFRVGGANLSRQMLLVVKRMIAGEPVTREESGMSKREWDELMEILAR